MTVTFAMLRDLDLQPLAALVEASAAFGRRCVAAQHAYETDVAGRLVRSGWRGEAAEHALRMMERHDDAFELAGIQQRSAAAALSTLHNRLSELHRRAHSIVDEVRAHELIVSGTGEIWDPRPATAPRYAHDPLGVSREAEVPRRLRVRIDALLADANRTDEMAGSELRRYGPGDDDWCRARDAARLAGAPLGVTSAAIPADDRPAVAAAWWAGLTPRQRELFLVAFPDQIGALDGLPTADRDQANRLDLRIAHGLSVDTGDERGTQRSQDLINRLESAQFEPVNPQLFLLDVDNRAADGTAVVAVGNPDTARHQAVIVPGVDSTLDRMNGEIDRAGRLRAAADGLTPTVPDDVAVVAWLDYDSPGQDLNALRGPMAEAGAARLSQFVDTLHQTSPGQLTVVGHSYGSTVVGVAAAEDGLRVDDIITAGSPGMRVDNVAALHTDPRHVWAGAAEGDDVSGWMSHFAHGPEPHREDFGANRFHVDTVGHSAYWDPDTASLANQAAIVVGQYDRVSLDHGAPPPDA